ncbi:MAG: T9SS type A sorting domain-containing protein [Bacteroidales bacterium]|nr:T9SS type A sorting domain-containing protein [Bacteroidales bacterium]
MKKILLISIVITAFNLSVFSQGGITNAGAVITINSGTYVVVDNGGGYFNSESGSNYGKVDLDGTLQIQGNFENNVTDANQHVFINTDGTGTVLFTGTANQHILNTTADAYIDFENLTVNKTVNTVFVDDGSAATVNGNLTVTDGTFRLSSPADGEAPSGSLITKGSVSGAGNLYVDRHFETAGRYQYISVPVINATDDIFDNTNNSHPFNANLYSYNEAYDAAVDPPNTNYSNWSSTTYGLYNAWTQVAADGSSVPLNPATGYITYNELELDVNFGGSPSDLNNNANYSPSVTYTPNDNTGGAGDYYDGWNIIGNPYPCALDFTTLTLNNINNCLYMWDGDAVNYKYYNNGGTTYDDGSNIVNGATQYIPAMQSFAIKTTGSSPSITIDNSDRTHKTQNMWKSPKNAPNYGQTQFVKLKTQDGNFSDETIVRFIDGTKDGFDNEYDAYKMFPNNPPVMIYSLITNPETPIAINSLPLDRIGTTIPLGFVSTDAGTYTITAEDVVFDAGTYIKLVDTYKNTETLLDEGTEYTFSSEAGEFRDRFYLFSATSSDVSNPEDNTMLFSSNVWANQNKVFITIKSNQLINANVKIFDVLGRIVTDKNINGTYNILNVPGASGTYFVKLTGANGISKTKKVFIQN